jgi:hypothetical protein
VTSTYIKVDVSPTVRSKSVDGFCWAVRVIETATDRPFPCNRKSSTYRTLVPSMVPWMLILASVYAAALAADPPTLQWLDARRMQSGCLVTSAGAETAGANVFSSVADEMELCSSYPCLIAVDNTQAYSDLMAACEAAGAVFHEFSLDITCEGFSYEISKLPLCLISEDINSACTPDSGELALESILDVAGCTDLASHTGTTDFSASGPTGSVPTDPPVSTVTIPTDAPATTGSVPTDPPAASPSSLSFCTVGSSTVDTARADLDTEVLADAGACTSSPCVIEVESNPEYNAMMDACESAQGAFYVFSVVLTCTAGTLQINDYPDCLASESQDPDCTTDSLETNMASLWDNDGCTETATLISTTDFSGGPSPDVPTDPPASPTDPPASPTDPPETPTDPPVSSQEDGTDECELSSDGLSTALEELGSDVNSEVDSCTFPCVIDADSSQAFNILKSACQDAQGAFHLYTLEISCDNGNTLTFNNMPTCWTSESSNSACDPDLFSDVLELRYDMEDCTETASLTGTTDFSPIGGDDPDTKPPTTAPIGSVGTPTRAPAGTETAPQASTPTSTRDIPGSTGLIPRSSGWALTARKNSGMIILAVVLPWTCALWI